MPRYFFHVQDGRDFSDTEGSELPDVQTAKMEAIRSSGELLRGNKGSSEFWSGKDWTLNVTDDKGGRVLTLRFSGELHV